MFKDIETTYFWVNVGDTDFSQPHTESAVLALSSTDVPYVASCDAWTGKPFVMKLEGNQWQNVGPQFIYSNQARFLSLVINPADNQPYLAFVRSTSSSHLAAVMKYDGSSWQYVGTPGFSIGQTINTNLAIDPSGGLYITYVDAIGSGKAIVKKFDGSDWIDVGSGEVSDGGTFWPTIACDQYGVVYLVYSDVDYSNKATVRKFNGSSWDYIGNRGFSPIDGNWKIAISPDNNLPVISNGPKLTMKFNGTSWDVVGGINSFKPSGVDYGFAVNSSGVPYVSFTNYDLLNKLSVIKFDGSDWVFVGNPGITSDSVGSTSIAINSLNIPVVAYQDSLDSVKIVVKKYDSIYTGIENKQAMEFLTLMPNPVSDFIQVRLTRTGWKEISIYNIQSVIVKSEQTLSDEYRLNVAEIGSGIYVVRVRMKDSIFFGRFVKI
ncbi:MAG: T9SS type A sorting domain-containing protein [Bacteroidetes bacterium]|nr:T9SS type A sorting domain-containing protein [Bacteroidota bacterium]